MRSRLLLVVALTAAAVVVVAPSAEADNEVPSPTLTDPPAGLWGHALWDSYFDLAPFGYEEHEYFVSGTAHDAAGTEAPYRTRIIVTRPSDAADFNGSVLLDWVNVTAQFENAVDTMEGREMLLREGFAHVHVSAQSAGLCCTPLTPQVWDPVRYASLDHPGDDFSFDIFTQIAQAFRTGPLAEGVERVLIAAGQSQSANRLSDYIESWLPSHPEAVGIVDAVLVHGNVPGDKDFAAASPVPVLQLLSDYEAVDDGVDPATLGPNHRLWEIAGTAHADLFIGHQSIAGQGTRLSTNQPVDQARYRSIIRTAGDYGAELNGEMAVCTAAGATMPMHYAASTAIHQLDAWVRTGIAPRNGPRFAFAGGRLATDGDGNTLGGIRLPPIDVPVARYVSTLCQLGGITVPFTDQQLKNRYGSHANYLSLMRARTDQAVTDGWLLPEDAVDLMGRACAARNRFRATGAPCPTYTPPAFGSIG